MLDKCSISAPCPSVSSCISGGEVIWVMLRVVLGAFFCLHEVREGLCPLGGCLLSLAISNFILVLTNWSKQLG